MFFTSTLPDLFLFFILYSFTGWIIESTYRSVVEKKWFINSGFLHNPVIPIYGFGALIILGFHALTLSWPFALQIFALIIILSAFEYFVGWLMETIFRIKLWDYSDFFLNIKGRICLFNTVVWGVLSVLLIKFIHPVGIRIIAFLPQEARIYVAITLVFVVGIDAVISMLELKVTAQYINKLAKNLMDVNEQIKDMFEATVKVRFLRTFPNLTRILEKGFKGNIGSILQLSEVDTVWKRISQILKRPSLDPEHLDPDYAGIVGDLLDHDEVKSMQTYKHHDKSTLHHALAVSEISWLLAGKFGLDERSTARGALLHDFYLYCWSTDGVRRHATGHPERALRNAVKHFELNDIEKDIIIKHMWPLTGKWFKYKESFLVSLVDKMVAAVEVTAMGTDLTDLIPKKSKKKATQQPEKSPDSSPV